MFFHGIMKIRLVFIKFILQHIKMEKFNSSISPSAEEVDTSYVEMAGGSLSPETKNNGEALPAPETSNLQEKSGEELRPQEKSAEEEKRAQELREQIQTSAVSQDSIKNISETLPPSVQETAPPSETMSGNRRESVLKGYFKNPEDFQFSGGLTRNFDEVVDLYKDSQVSRIQKIKVAGLATSAAGVFGGSIAIGGAGVASSALAIPGIGLGIGAGVLGYYGFKRFKIWNDARKARGNEDLRRAFNQEKELDALL